MQNIVFITYGISNIFHPMLFHDCHAKYGYICVAGHIIYQTIKHLLLFYIIVKKQKKMKKNCSKYRFKFDKKPKIAWPKANKFFPMHKLSQFCYFFCCCCCFCFIIFKLRAKFTEWTNLMNWIICCITSFY